MSERAGSTTHTRRYVRTCLFELAWENRRGFEAVERDQKRTDDRKSSKIYGYLCAVMETDPADSGDLILEIDSGDLILETGSGARNDGVAGTDCSSRVA